MRRSESDGTQNLHWFKAPDEKVTNIQFIRIYFFFFVFIRTSMHSCSFVFIISRFIPIHSYSFLFIRIYSLSGSCGSRIEVNTHPRPTLFLRTPNHIMMCHIPIHADSESYNVSHIWHKLSTQPSCLSIVRHLQKSRNEVIIKHYHCTPPSCQPVDI